MGYLDLSRASKPNRGPEILNFSLQKKLSYIYVGCRNTNLILSSTLLYVSSLIFHLMQYHVGFLLMWRKYG